MRRKNSERRLDEAVREDVEREEKGILEIFPRDEDEPLSRDGEEDEDAE